MDCPSCGKGMRGGTTYPQESNSSECFTYDHKQYSCGNCGYSIDEKSNRRKILCGHAEHNR